MSFGKLYLIPTILHDDAFETIPSYILDSVKDCQVFFVENEKTARRFLKRIWKEMIIDNYQWYAIHKAEQEVKHTFIQILKSGKNIGILSEAGCPGVADPGQLLINAAQEINVLIKPLVGPNAILLALMASGMNGQCFQFHGYLPIDQIEKRKKIKELEIDSHIRNCTQIFIETPYRNNQLFKDILQVTKDETRLCIGIDITSSSESIQSKSIKEWKKVELDIHKKLAIFLMQAS